MKTFKQFSFEMREAVQNLQEAEGFAAAKKKKKKQKFGSKRDRKISALKNRPGLWSGLENLEVE